MSQTSCWSGTHQAMLVDHRHRSKLVCLVAFLHLPPPLPCWICLSMQLSQQTGSETVTYSQVEEWNPHWELSALPYYCLCHTPVHVLQLVHCRSTSSLRSFPNIGPVMAARGLSLVHQHCMQPISNTLHRRILINGIKGVLTGGELLLYS